MGLVTSDLNARVFRSSSASSSSSSVPGKRSARKKKKKPSASSSSSTSVEGEEGDNRRSLEWEQQYRSSTEFVRLRKESLFAGKFEPGLTGLKNLGNTCFMNAALQCLSHTAPLTDFFVGSDVWKKDLNKKNVLGTGGKLAMEYAALMRKIWDSQTTNSKKVKAIAPKQFKSIVSSFAPLFSGYAQHDCQELLVFLLDGLHEDLNRVEQKPYVEVPDANGRKDEVVAAEQWKFHLMRNKSIIVDLLQGQLKSSLTCSQCKFVSVMFDPFMYLSLPFPETSSSKTEISIEDMLAEFLKPETLEGDEAWYCPKCKKHVNATKKLDLWKLPPILMVHFKRFKYGRIGSKINTAVTFPLEDFSFADYALSEQRVLPNYDLYAVSRHIGSVSGGHYTALAKNRISGSWYSFDDSNCHPVGEAQVQTKDAYILFYQNHQITEQGYRRQSVSKPKNWPHSLPENELRKICGTLNATSPPSSPTSSNSHLASQSRRKKSTMHEVTNKGL